MAEGINGETNSKFDQTKVLKCTEPNAINTLAQAAEISDIGDGDQSVVGRNDAKASGNDTEAPGSGIDPYGQQALPVADEMDINENTVKIKETERDVNKTQGVSDEIQMKNAESAERPKNVTASRNLRGPGLGRGLLVSGNGAVPNGNYNYRLDWFNGFSSEPQTRQNRSERIIRTHANEINGRPITHVTKMTIVQRKMTVPRLVRKVEQLTSLYGEDHHLVITYESYLNRLRGSTYPVAYIHTDTLISHSYEPM